eukprot:5019293-Prymnesium_polylepis.1
MRSTRSRSHCRAPQRTLAAPYRAKKQMTDLSPWRASCRSLPPVASDTELGAPVRVLRKLSAEPSVRVGTGGGAGGGGDGGGATGAEAGPIKCWHTGPVSSVWSA